MFVYVLFVPLLLIPVLSPATLVLTLPSFAIQLLSTCPLHYTINNQYTASVIPFLFVSFVYGLKTLNSKRREVAIMSVLIVSFYFNIMIGASPLSCSFWDYKKPINPYSFKNYTISKRDMLLNSTIHSIQEMASVCAQNSVYTSYLAKRDIFYLFPYEYERTDYIILDETRLKYVGGPCR